MSISYSYIPTSDLEATRPYILQKDAVKCNLTHTECAIKWDGATPPKVIELGSPIMTYSEALDYFNNTSNGWCVKDNYL